MEEWRSALPEVFFGFTANFIGQVEVERAIARCPLERILLETDSPYLSPFTNQTVNVPWNIMVVADAVAQLKNIPVALIFETVNSNAHRFYSLN